MRHRSRLSASACPLARNRSVTPSFLAMSPAPSLRGRFTEGLGQIPGLHAFGHTPHRAFPSRCNAYSRTKLLHLFTTSLARHSKCNRPTAFTGLPLLAGSPIYYDAVLSHDTRLMLLHTIWRSALGCVPGRFVPAITHGQSRPRSNIPFTCTRALV